jgi:hypothetical protein
MRYGKEEVTEEFDALDEAEMAHEIWQAKHARAKSYRRKVSPREGNQKIKLKGVRGHNKKKESRYKEGETVLQAT